MFFWAMSDLQRRFLNCFQKTTVPFISFGIAMSMHPFWCYYLAVKLEMGVVGIALADIIAHFITFVAMNLFFMYDKELGEARALPDKRSFSGLGGYVAIGIPSLMMLFLEFWAENLMIVTSGLLGVKEQAAMVIVFNMNELTYSVGAGIQGVACSLLGN